MKKLSCKTKVSVITIVMLLTLSAIAMTLPTAIAQPISFTKKTYAFIGAVPNPVGVNQEVLLHLGITDMLGIQYDGWKDITISVQKPNGNTEILGPFTTDSTGGTGTSFYPDMAGTYRLQTHFPEQTYFWSSFPVFIPEFFLQNVLYESSDSEILELEVQQDPIEYYQAHSLPEEYWTRPIDAQLREWNRISANWLGETLNRYAPYNEYAPETSHILWTKPITTGGLSGGASGPHGMECGDAYEGKFQDSVIINGMLFYNRYAETFTGPMTPQKGIYAVDLRTGEELWFKNNTKVDFGQTLFFDSFNYHGVFDYIWEFNAGYFPGAPELWNAYDPFTGEWVCTYENVPFGPTITGPSGEILRYIVNLQQGWMALWNSTEVVLKGTDGGSWERYLHAAGGTFDASRGISWNVSIPNNLPGSVIWGLEDRIIGNNETGYWAPNIGDRPITMWGISTAPGTEGDLLFRETWQPPSGDLGIGSRAMAASVEDGLFTLFCKETRQIWGFDIDTGEEIWGPTEALPYMAQYNIETNIAQGKVFINGRYSGVVRALDAQTGNVLWTYEVTDPQSEILWSKNWPIQTLFITDDKIYVGQTEHSPISPKPRGAPFICLDIESGEEVFRAEGLFRQTDWGGLAIIGDSIIATMDTYDQRIYAIGRGPSETKVSINDDVISLGDSVLLKGTVMDISAGTKDSALTARFPAGVPAVADADMSEWMLYVYKQFEVPADVNGVEVTLHIQDPNGDWYSATVTTVKSGLFSHSWAPGIVGDYHVTAVFEGTGGYYGSFATTVFTVDPAPEYPASPTAEEIAAESASRTIAMMPQFPDVPTQEAIADNAARRTIAMLPQYPTPYPPAEIPAYQTIDLVLMVLVIIGIVIGLYIVIKKK